MRQVVEILGYKPDCFGRRYLLGGKRRKTHRFDALGFMEGAAARAMGRGDWLHRAACCEMCRRAFSITDHVITTCQRGDCMRHAAGLRGFAVHSYPPVRLT